MGIGGRLWRLNRCAASTALQRLQFHIINHRTNVCRPPKTAIRSYSTPPRNAQSQSELSHDLISIMEQKLSAIENRHTHLQVIVNQEAEGLKSLIAEAQDDKDMQQMAAEELGQASNEERRLRYLLLKSLLPKDDADERDCVLEVRAGTGGDEASLFAMDIFKMYEKYSQKKGWKFEVLDVAESDLKGYKEASAAISGADVYGKLKFESGIHRVQ